MHFIKHTMALRVYRNFERTNRFFFSNPFIIVLFRRKTRFTADASVERGGNTREDDYDDDNNNNIQ